MCIILPVLFIVTIYPRFSHASNLMSNLTLTCDLDKIDGMRYTIE